MASDRDYLDHWTATADRVCADTLFLLGEGDDGRFYVRELRGDRWRRMSHWNPRYWMAYLGSRLTHQIVFLELGY
ncbi:hypothetical protein A5733_03395 [Mycobacterium sp. NS-7484]|uniref:hypothetical protein n=1 Tax=Mycobacterium sp. NS-7484 TaxID=1834161 RepID=UPI00096F9380|nr:hypothetical protein [Mycobacterium sp. NS-7484]OMC00896.1 hypothetical protein A5733_03395 [Mycobacterium sp. NS-7484]